jgi:hypothetical protein
VPSINKTDIHSIKGHFQPFDCRADIEIRNPEIDRQAVIKGSNLFYQSLSVDSAQARSVALRDEADICVCAET